MALVLHALLCSGMLNGTRHGKAIVYSSSIPKNLWKNVANVIPHSSKAVHTVPPCDKDITLSSYIMYALHILCPPQGYLPMVIDWTPTTRLVPCQDQPGPAHGPWAYLH